MQLVPPPPADDPVRARLDRLQRRRKRDQRAAWASGYLTAICGMLRPGDLAIDCGANVGEVSAALLASGAEVIAFDPEPWAAARLRERFAGEPRFRLVEAAVGARAGTVSLMRAGNFRGNEARASVKSTVVAGGRMIDGTGAQTIAVAQIDLVAFLRDCLARRGGQEIAFLKIDVEGAELALLPALDAAGLFSAIRCTVVETHERKFRELRPEFAELRRRFAAKYPASKLSLDWI